LPIGESIGRGCPPFEQKGSAFEGPVT